MTIIDGKQDSVVVLGTSLTLPPSDDEAAGTLPGIGSLRFNTVSQEVELYFASPLGWRLPNSQSLSPNDYLSKSGGQMTGNIIDQSNFWATTGSVPVPSVSFNSRMASGIETSDGVLNIVVNGVAQLSADNSDLTMLAVQSSGLTVNTANCNTLITPNLSNLPVELCVFYRGTPVANQALSRRIISSAMQLAINFGSSRAVTRNAATQTTTFQINLVRSGSTIVLGQLVFPSNTTQGNYLINTATTLQAGDIIEFVSPSSVSSSLTDISLTITNR